MPTIEETSNMLGYYDEARSQKLPDNPLYMWEAAPSVAKSLGWILDEEDNFQRWPIRNREPRTPISPQKRAIIHARDGNICRLCGTGGHVLTVDHIIPRSAFMPEHLYIADRSDNLISACWDCNEQKSNYEHEQLKRPGVVVACWDCQNPWYDAEKYQYDLEYQDPKPDCTHIAYCGRCGLTTIPEVDGWVL